MLPNYYLDTVLDNLVLGFVLLNIIFHERHPLLLNTEQLTAEVSDFS